MIKRVFVRVGFLRRRRFLASALAAAVLLSAAPVLAEETAEVATGTAV
jgi:hypothetical protein